DFVLATKVDVARAALVRRSTTKPDASLSISTTQRKPLQTTDLIATVIVGCRSAETWSSTIGTRHSCKLSPPCAYSAPAMNDATPGAKAICTSLHQSQPKVKGVPCAVSLRTAQRPQRVSA